MAHPDPGLHPERSRFARGCWFALGWLSVAIGGVGVVVPGLPTTGFMVLAASCFARSSPRFEQWVLDLPGIGPSVTAYRRGDGMPVRAKVIALTMMTVAVVFAAGFAIEPVPIRVVVAGAGLIGWWYLLLRVPTANGSDRGDALPEPSSPSTHRLRPAVDVPESGVAAWRREQP